MQKCINFFFAISIISLSLLSSNARAQSITYELAESENGSYTIKFTSYVPVGFKFCRFDFDVMPDETIVVDEVYVFSAPLDVINVTLYYTLIGGDCTATDPNITSQVIPIYPGRAHFTVEYDSQLDTLATLKRVLRSSLDIDNNSIEDIGNLRFFWTFDEKMIPKPEVDFETNNPSLGQYPNVYYTFPNGGVYAITLKVVDVTSSSNIATFTRVLNLNPVFGLDLIDFEYVPNVFTPTESPNNYFQVESSGTSQLSFKAFSRSGALVYEYTGNVIKWDGKNYYGTDLPTGIYYYIIEDINTPKKYNTAKGFFYIYR